MVNAYFCAIITLLDVCMGSQNCYCYVNKQIPAVDGLTVTGFGKEGLFTILYKDKTRWWVLSCTPRCYCINCSSLRTGELVKF